MRVSGSGGPFWRGLNAMLPALALTALLAWALAHHERSVLPAFVAGAALAAALARWLRLPRHDLGWDGRVWQADGRDGRLALQLDLGRWMLLRFVPDPARSRVSWIALAASEIAPADWHALRVAVHAARPAREPVLPGA